MYTDTRKHTYHDKTNIYYLLWFLIYVLAKFILAYLYFIIFDICAYTCGIFYWIFFFNSKESRFHFFDKNVIQMQKEFFRSPLVLHNFLILFCKTFKLFYQTNKFSKIPYLKCHLYFKLFPLPVTFA